MRTQAQRFTAIDGLRGIAALSVVLYHLTREGDWGLLGPLFDHGFLGVEVFFVISGFVIAHSVVDAEHTPRFFGFFALRRILRLDPPYWVTIGLELLLLQITLLVMPAMAGEIPRVGKVLSHLVYAQNLTGQGDILSIFWTLCFEVQFYLFFVGSLVLWRRVRDRIPARVGTALLATLFLFSVTARYGPLIPDVPGLAHERWFQFFLGALTYWCVMGRAHMAWLGAAWGVIAAFTLSPWAPADAMTVVAVSAFVAAVALRGELGTALSSAPLQYLGRQSYSLYLIHLVVGSRAAAVLAMLLPGGRAVQWIVLMLGTASSIIAADLMWRLVERPSMAWSKRMRPARIAIPAVQQHQRAPLM